MTNDIHDLSALLAEQKAKLTAILARTPVVADADYEMDVTDDWLDLTGDDQNIAVALFSTEATDEAWLSDAGHGRFTEHPYTAYTATLNVSGTGVLTIGVGEDVGPKHDFVGRVLVQHRVVEPALAELRLAVRRGYQHRLPLDDLDGRKA